jgi:hypothetical protein
VQLGWLSSPDEPTVEQVATPVKGSGVVPKNDEAEREVSRLVSGPPAPDFSDEQPTALRVRSVVPTLAPMPMPLGVPTAPPPMNGIPTTPPTHNVPTKPPPPPPSRRKTQEIEAPWVELNESDLEEAASGELPKLFDEKEAFDLTLTRVEESPISTERLEKERAAVLAEVGLEGPPIPDSLREARVREALETSKRAPLDEGRLAQETRLAEEAQDEGAQVEELEPSDQTMANVYRLAEEARLVDEARLAEQARKERLAEFLRAMQTPIAPTVEERRRDDSTHDSLREEALAARKREQDARDREILSRRRAERERERIEEEAKQARRDQEKRDEAERAAARQGAPNAALLDLSGIDDEIDSALDTMFGSTFSEHPPPPSDDSEEK